MSPTETKIREFIVESFYVPEEVRLTVETPLLASGIVDSTGVLEILDYLEHELGVRVGDDEMLPENLGSIACIARLVERKRGVGAAVLEEPQPV